MIVLVRHGRTSLTKPSFWNSLGLKNWIDEYNSAGIHQQDVPPQALISIVKDCELVISSDFARARESAKLLRESSESFPLFDEARLPYPSFLQINISPLVLVPLFRFFWFLGYSRNSESFFEARKRALIGVKELIRLAEAKGPVVCVGHGMMNRLLSKELRSQGWVGPKNPGSHHWGFGVYTEPHLNFGF